MPEQGSEGTYLRAVKEPLGGPGEGLESPLEEAPKRGLEGPLCRPRKGAKRGLEGPLFFTPGALGGPGIP